VDEVIVVDDASVDGTAEVASACEGATLIRLPANRGKTWALSAGIEAARYPLLMLLDADLLGLTPDAVTALIAPVRAGRAEVSISLRGNAPRLWRQIGLDYISGERVLPLALLRDGGNLLRTLPRFGFEAHLNALWIARQYRIAVVPWDGVASPFKQTKMGLLPGLRADAWMMADIFRTVSPLAALQQIHAMRRLRISG
jgi:glycosyltransferase involved in cell wall biosynthesis